MCPSFRRLAFDALSAFWERKRVGKHFVAANQMRDDVIFWGILVKGRAPLRSRFGLSWRKHPH